MLWSTWFKLFSNDVRTDTCLVLCGEIAVNIEWSRLPINLSKWSGSLFGITSLVSIALWHGVSLDSNMKWLMYSKMGLETVVSIWSLMALSIIEPKSEFVRHGEGQASPIRDNLNHKETTMNLEIPQSDLPSTCTHESLL